MVIINTSAVEVSIQAVSPVSRVGVGVGVGAVAAASCASAVPARTSSAGKVAKAICLNLPVMSIEYLRRMAASNASALKRPVQTERNKNRASCAGQPRSNTFFLVFTAQQRMETWR